MKRKEKKMIRESIKKKKISGTSLMVQWLRLHAPNAGQRGVGGTGLINPWSRN